jgi:hypothetical protein
MKLLTERKSRGQMGKEELISEMGKVQILSGPGFRIRIDLMRIRIPDPGFDDLKLKKIHCWKFNSYFRDQKLQFTYP